MSQLGEQARADVGAYVLSVLKGSPSPFSYNDIYRRTYTLRNHAGDVKAIVSLLTECIHRFIEENPIPEGDDGVVLESAAMMVKDFPERGKKIASHLSYISPNIRDSPEDGCNSLYRVLMKRFSVLYLGQILDPDRGSRDRISTALLKELDNSLEDDLVFPAETKSLVSFMYTLRSEIQSEILDSLFERYLENARSYYSDESKSLSHSNDVVKFYGAVKEMYEKETVFQGDELRRQYDCLFECTVGGDGRRLLEDPSTGLDFLALRDNWGGLTTIYECSRKNHIATDILLEVLSKYIRTQFHDDLAQERIKDAKGWITGILGRYCSLLDIVSTCFSDDKSYFQCLGNEMESLFKDSAAAPMSLALYLDSLIRCGELSQIGKDLSHAVDLFRYIGSKDIFTKHYVYPLLIHRLLECVRSPEEELEIAEKFADEGPSVVDPMKQAISGYKLACQALQKISSSDSAFRMMRVNMEHTVVLDHMIVAVDPTMTTVHPPAALKRLSETFTQAYCSLHPQKNLTFHWKEGRLMLSYTLSASTYTLQCTTFQGMALMLLNSEGALLISDLCRVMNVDSRHMIPHLIPMLIKRVLVTNHVQTRGNPIHPGVLVALNPSFRPSTVKVVLPLPSRVLSISNVADESIHKLRKDQLDACIVRYMKTHTTGVLNDLFQHCQSYLRQHFSLTRSLLITSINSLLQRGYIEETASESYKYIT